MHVLKVILIVFLVVWILSMVVYFFNLDMKLTAALEPILASHYDHVKRDKHL